MHLSKYFLVLLAVSVLEACIKPPEKVVYQSPSISSKEREQINQNLLKHLGPAKRYLEFGQFDPEVFTWQLRNTLFYLEPKLIKSIKQDLVKLEYNGNHIKLVTEAIDWRRAQEKSSADEVYRKAQLLRHEAYAIPRQLIFSGSRWDGLYLHKSSLAAKLFELSGTLGNSTAKSKFQQEIDFDAAMTHLSHYSRKDPSNQEKILDNLKTIRQFANQNYMPAQFDLFYRYQRNRFIKPNLTAAIYWGERAVTNGANIKQDVSTFLRRLSPQEIKLIKHWKVSKTLPNLSLKE